MKIGFNPRQIYEKSKKNISEAYTNTIKPTMRDGLKYTKKIGVDTLDFAKKKPLKAGLIAGAGVLLATGAAYLVKMVRQNKIMEKHINNQSEFIEDLKEEITDRQEIIDGLHSAVEAAHEHFQKIQD